MAGMDDYLSKPIDPEEMFLTIEQWIVQNTGAEEITKDFSGQEALVNSPPINLAATMPRFGNDKNFFKELLTEFVEGLNERCQAIQQSLLREDDGELTRLAHNLKGVSANFGADRLTAAASELEIQARGHNLSHAPALIEKIEMEIPILKEYLDQLPR
jgi:two-component system sensor histidine kinase/response regulator